MSFGSRPSTLQLRLTTNATPNHEPTGSNYSQPLPLGPQVLANRLTTTRSAEISAQQTCQSHEECGDSSFCRGINDPFSCSLSHTCVPIPQEGEICDVYFQNCRHAECASSNLKCVPGISLCLQLGNNCQADTDCTADQFCARCFATSSGSGFCLPLPIADEPCRQYCASHVCAEGHYCGEDFKCHVGSTTTSESTTATTSESTFTTETSPSYFCVNRPCTFDEALPCQCDAACPSYGDCCPDFADQCTSPTTVIDSTTETATADPITTIFTPSSDAPLHFCVNRPCSFDDTLPCQCDAECPSYGDCCPDFEVVCLETGSSSTSGATTTIGDDTTLCAARGCGAFDEALACQCDVACTSYGDCCPGTYEQSS
eukprot:gene2711-5589_t